MTTQTCLIDFETASTVDLKAAGAWRYSEDPTTEVLCLGYSTNGLPPEVWVPGEDTAYLSGLAHNPEITFVAHNAGFEKAIWRNIMVPCFGFPDIPDDRWHDTMAVCAMKTLPQDLDGAVLMLRLPYQKDTAGSKLTRSLSKPNKKGDYDRSPETLEKVYDYCRKDILAEAGLHTRLGWLPKSEHRVWLLDQRINQRGVRLDLEYIVACNKVVSLATIPLAQTFRELTGGLEFTQVAKVVEWVRGQGVDLPDMKKETLAEVLGIKDDEDEGDTPAEENNPRVDLPANVRRALGIRQLIGSAAVKKLPRMESCVGGDGRARGLLQYHGAGPGRWAGRLLQPQNFPRGTIKIDGKAPDPDLVVASIMTGDPDWVEMTVGPAVETVVGGLRHAIIASEGCRLVAGDFAQVEARIVLALAGQHDKTALMASGKSAYIDIAQQIFGRPLTKEANPWEYHIGKGSVLGLGFSMGAATFQNRYAPLQPMSFCQGVVETYRKEWAPCVPKVWYALERAAADTVWKKTPHEAYGVRYALEDLWLTARLPSGRKLWYFNPQPVKVQVPWDPTEERNGFTYQARKMNVLRTINAFGGLLVENVVQGLARDIMVSAMFKAEENGFPVVLTVHDEIVADAEVANADPLALQQLMCDIPDWARALGVPIAAETWVGDRYKK